MHLEIVIAGFDVRLPICEELESFDLDDPAIQEEILREVEQGRIFAAYMAQIGLPSAEELNKQWDIDGPDGADGDISGGPPDPLP